MIALFGGTFDPVHQGHIDLARRALQTYDFRHLYLIPNKRNPLKEAGTQATGTQRARMLELALRAWGEPRVSLRRDEIEREGPSYTIRTVERLRRETGEPLAFLLGNEVYSSLPHWHRAGELVELCHFIVVTRDSHQPVDLMAPLRALGVPAREREGGRRVDLSHTWVERFDITALPYNATALRAQLSDPALRSRRGVPDGLHKDVWEYIKENSLYLR